MCRFSGPVLAVRFWPPHAFFPELSPAAEAGRSAVGKTGVGEKQGIHGGRGSMPPATAPAARRGAPA